MHLGLSGYLKKFEVKGGRRFVNFCPVSKSAI